MTDRRQGGITLNLYSHLTMDMQRQAADRLDALTDEVSCDQTVTNRTIRTGEDAFVHALSQPLCRVWDSNPHSLAATSS